MEMLRRNFFALVFAACALAPNIVHASPAQEHVADFQAKLLEVMKSADSLGVQGRFEKLKPIVSDAFNLPLMAGLSAGEYWKTSTPDQRKRLVEEFSRNSVATLATLFGSYSGETFEVTGERAGPQNITIVTTTLKSPSREKPVEISYVARKKEGSWKLIDVIVDGGISELKVRMSEYNQTLKEGGMEGLISLLKNKADELLS